MATDFLYDGADIQLELPGAATPVSYLRGLTIDEPLVRDGTEFYLTDALGSVLALTDSADTVMTSYVYEPFGRVAEVGLPSANPFRFTGREYDGSNDLYYYRARYYHGAFQRFLSEDPIGLAGGDVNLYAYVANSPLLLVDPSGQALNLVGAGVGALIGGVVGATSAALSGGSTAQIIAGAGFGALSGATAGVTLGGGLLVNAAFGAGIGAIADIGSQLLTTGTVDPISVAIGGAAGALGGRAAFQAGAAGLSGARAAGIGGAVSGVADIGGRLAFPTGTAEGEQPGAPPLSGRK